MVLFGQNGCIRANWLYSCIFVVFGQWFYSQKSSRIRAKWLYSGKSCCVRAKVAVLRHSGFKLESGCNLAKVFVFGKMFVFGQRCCIRARAVVLGQSSCIRAKVVVFGQSGCIRTKMVVFREK